MRWYRPLKPLLRLGERFLDRILCVAGAVAFSQFPEFVQQYLQRLGGHLAEARRQLAAFSEAARQAGLTLDEFIERTRGNADSAVARLGDLMQGTLDRVHDLGVASTAIHDAGIWGRPFAFLRHFDAEIAAATWDMFKPAVPTTLEGLIYALVGMAFVFCLYHSIVWCVMAAFAKKPGKPASKSSTIKPVGTE